ncbi:MULTISPECIES: DUF4197 domain-containing protein [Pasteurellaceae]|uniref:DUF4197 domain-containing protein n=1 Tax=Pasteurella atlantica TaxID=2827233 RepID=A0AAW8CMG5_9PAST|nr:DUF4197 domain-containing protein [Pasteurella atlantica]MBR0572652.1 DUF4197 domain-containing protein [Pasteurella atlantica]MDP8038598.1 DUF4197 domain-containing protein [Pasteurella atlantica]MDP8040690.1 DUF4197 domain-containing protein [Pasteurella atlantica]MDP8042825.1 DUF4197 domain-containing protein [Pasteurella atlantica]MDP8044912.1 DUF4197 domain-containing protein [Pasteurella atlantica]
MKKIIILTTITLIAGCKNLENLQLPQQVMQQLPSVMQNTSLSQMDIATALRQALNNGVSHQVSKLTAVDGFYKNKLVKIALPKELQMVNDTLHKVGLGHIAEKGVKALNRSAEDAVKTATPIFVNAIKNISFSDAKNILMGSDNAATQYLQTQTFNQLYRQFNPVIKKSFTKVGADTIWQNVISQYNNIPFVNKVNPNLNDYVTNEALKGVFTMIAKEEQGIRHNVGLRNTRLLKQVFSSQDYK